MTIVYHIASIGDWQTVFDEQTDLLVLSRLNAFPLFFTHVGPPSDAAWIIERANQKGLTPKLEQTDANILHYETFAMLLIERVARESDEPILYFHTKGVSASWHQGKRNWRLLMEREVVRDWQKHLPGLLNNEYDAVGVNWCQWDDPHFSGNFWIARADWIRRLPDFVAYHSSRQFVRTNCEFWIGASAPIRVKSLACSGHTMWDDHYDWTQHFAQRVNFGSGDFPMSGWLNVDVRPEVNPDLVADVATCQFVCDSFHEIYCGHVLEHLAAPIEFLRRCYGWLRAGGALTITVPNFAVAARRHHEQRQANSWEMSGERIAFGQTDPVEQRHTQAFTPETLIPLLRYIGFRDVRLLSRCEYWVAAVDWQFTVTGNK
jgi:hypothetical protein